MAPQVALVRGFGGEATDALVHVAYDDLSFQLRRTRTVPESGTTAAAATAGDSPVPLRSGAVAAEFPTILWFACEAPDAMKRTKLIATVAIVAMVTIALRRRDRSAEESAEDVGTSD